jgi:hypothetical protein
MIDIQTLDPLDPDVHGLIDWRPIRPGVVIRDEVVLKGKERAGDCA